MFVNESIRQANDILPPPTGAVFARATVTTTEVCAIPWTNTTGALVQPEYWTFVASTVDVYISFNTSSSITVTVATNSSLSTNTLTASANTGFLILAGQRLDVRIPRTITHFGHNSLATTGRLFFYQSSGIGE